MMIEQTAMDENCSRLVQLSVQKHLSAPIVDDILKDGSVDYQIPVNFIQNSRKEKLKGSTALHIVVQNLDVQAAQRLLRNRADFTIQNSVGESVLHQAIVETHFLESTKSELIDTIDAILEAHVQFSITKNPCDRNGLSHFHAACIANHEAAVKFFISKGTSVNRPINSQSPYAPGCTPQHLAVKYSGITIFKVLLDHGADVTLKNTDNLTPLHLLIERNIEIAYLMEVSGSIVSNDEKTEFTNNKRMIELVLEKYQDNREALLYDTGLPYFHILCTLQSASKVEQFLSVNTKSVQPAVDLEQSIQKDSPLWSGCTALHFAANFGIETVKVLLKYGANILAKDDKGVTTSIICMSMYKAEDIYFIIRHQPALKSIMLSDGETSLLELLYAMRSENSLEIFIQKADVNITVPVNSSLWPGFTPLHLAVRLASRDEGDEVSTLYLERIRILLNAGANVSAKNQDDSSPIHVAYRLYRFDAIPLLLQTNQLILDDFDHDQVSHLHVACAAGNLNVVQNMFQGDVYVDLPLIFDYKFHRIDDANLTPKEYSFIAGSTPLHIAVITKNVAITRLLVERGADVHAKDNEELTPIHRLLDFDYCPDVAAIGEILFAVEDLKDVETSFGLSHLHVACWVNDKTAVERLLDQGVDICVRLSKNPLPFLNRCANYRPINFAYCRKRTGVMELLFQRCHCLLGDPKPVLDAARYTSSFTSFSDLKSMHDFTLETWQEQYGLELLHVACYKVDADAVEELLKHGADPNKRVSSDLIFWTGLTPLHILMRNVFANEQKVVRIAQLLLDYGADVAMADPDGDTAIHRVFDTFKFSKRKQTLLLLLNGETNFDVDSEENSERISHFHFACMCDATSVVENFLGYGIDINQTIHPMVSIYGGYAPLHLAALFGAKDTVDMLLRSGADVHAMNGEGNTALHCATMCNKKLGGSGEISESIITSLIGAGAKIDTTNIHSETPLEVLLKTRRPSNELLKMLSKKRCVNIFNYYKNGTGLIATAIKRQTNIKCIMEHPVYQAVINESKINEVDKHGQTPIHNIVSISKIAASVKVYTKAIEGFVNVGYYIDQQDIMGRTALYVAVYFQNSKAVAALLTLGASINLLCDGETAFAHHWKHCKNFDMTKLLEREKQIANSFAKQVYKLQLINFHVSEMDMAIGTELRERQWNLDLKIVEQCQVELERMETRKIGESGISWWSLLSETGVIAAFPTMRQIDRRMICDVFEKQSFRFHQEFPEFAGILHWQYRKAIDRMSLIEPSKGALCWLINSNLPDLCSDRILRFLENADLADLIDANENPVIHVNKRKRII